MGMGMGMGKGKGPEQRKISANQLHYPTWLVPISRLVFPLP